MKFKKLTACGIVAVAVAGFAMASTSALANTHKTTKNVKCYTDKNTCKNKCKKTGTSMVSSKSACDKLGGTTTQPSKAPQKPAAPKTTAPQTNPTSSTTAPQTSDATNPNAASTSNLAAPQEGNASSMAPGAQTATPQPNANQNQ